MNKLFNKITRPIRLTFKELKRVEWLSFEETMKATMLVLVISFFVGIIIVVLDTAFFNARNFIIEL